MRDFETDYLKNNSMPKPGNGFSDLWLNVKTYCLKTALVWAVGSGLVSILCCLTVLSFLKAQQ